MISRFFTASAHAAGLPPKVLTWREMIVLLRPLERLEDLALHGGGGERQVGARDALGHRHYVRLDAVVLVAETPARAAETADHLVHDEQDAVLPAILASST